MDYTMIDPSTLRHMTQWVDRQFGSDQSELIATMVEQYETNPELYDRAGWWRCHDDMCASGKTTLIQPRPKDG